MRRRRAPVSEINAQEAWDELKHYVTEAEKIHREICKNFGWHEQAGDNIFTDILKVMEDLEKKHA